MANVAIGAGFDDGLAGVNGDIEGEEAAEEGHGVPTESDSTQHEDDAEEEDHGAVPSDGGLGEEVREGEGRSGCGPVEDDQEVKGAAVADFGGVGGTFGAAGGGFEEEPGEVGGEKDGGVEEMEE